MLITNFNFSHLGKANIQLETQHPEAQRKIAQLEADKPGRPEKPEKIFDKPIFTQLLTGPTELWEGQMARYECRVVPVGDASLRFEWYINGVELKMGKNLILMIHGSGKSLRVILTVCEIRKENLEISEIQMFWNSRNLKIKKFRETREFKSQRLGNSGIPNPKIKKFRDSKI